MNSKVVIQDLRRKFSVCGWAVLIYFIIMNIVVSLAVFVDALVLLFRYYITHGQFPADWVQQMMERSAGNGWGYLLACVIYGIVLLLWKKRDFCFRTIWTRERRMSGKSFFVLFCIFLSAQAVQILLTPVIEWLLNQIGLSAMASLESAAVGTSTVSMFLYVAIIAPIFEEIIFRGVILRNLLPYGKKFAIIASSFLFGLLHGNIIQSPYAFMVGLVLGYTAVEYGMIWSVVLHIFNNLVLGDLSTRITELIPVFYVNVTLYTLIFGCAIVSLALAAINSRRIADYLSSRKIHPWCLRGFFSSGGVIVFSVIMVANMILLLFL